MPEHRAGRFILKMIKVHLAAQTAMVALLRLFQHGEVSFEIFFGRPCGAVDALQHGVVRIAAPIGPGDAQQLEAIANLRGGRHMRPAAQIEPLPLSVDFNVLAFGDRIDQLDLVVLALVRKNLSGLVPGPDLFGEGLPARDYLAHFLFDFGQVFRRE